MYQESMLGNEIKSKLIADFLQLLLLTYLTKINWPIMLFARPIFNIILILTDPTDPTENEKRRN